MSESRRTALTVFLCLLLSLCAPAFAAAEEAVPSVDPGASAGAESSLPQAPPENIYSFSYTYVNPVYADIVRESDIPKVSAGTEERIEELLALAAGPDRSGNRGRARYNAESGVLNTTIHAAGQELKEQIMTFEETATVRLLVESEPAAASWLNLCAAVFSAAVAHTGIPTEGDYLRYEYGGYNATGDILSEDGRYICLFKYSLFHYTTAGQEAELTEAAGRILSELALDGKSDYVKVRAIYDYLCSRVSYGGTGNVKHTAYGALVDHLCVCQGYSAAFYRLCLASGIDARIITRSGNSENHSWNIVRLGGQYYEADAAWDCGHSGSGYLYFLRGSGSWPATGHNTLGDQFSDGDFSGRYMPPAYDYVSYDAPGLEECFSGLDTAVASLSERYTNSNIERFRVGLAADSTGPASGGICAFDVYPRIAACSGESVIAQEAVGSGMIAGGALFSVSLPVPGSWDGRRAVYTVSGEGGEGAGTSVDITSGDGGCAAQIGGLPLPGRITLALLYRVSLDPGNGQPALTLQVPAGRPAERPPDPAREGYWFLGWFATDSREAYDFENTPAAADCSLSAGWAAPDFVLPGALSAVGDEAFAGGAFRFVKLSGQTASIGRRAFAGCPNLAFIYIPEATVYIDPEAFSGVSGLTVFGRAGSEAEKFAASMHYHFAAVY